VCNVCCVKSEHVETVFSFWVASYRSCKNLWKSCVEYHTFLCSRQCKQTASWLTDGQKQDVLDLRYRFDGLFIEQTPRPRSVNKLYWIKFYLLDLWLFTQYMIASAFVWKQPEYDYNISENIFIKYKPMRVPYCFNVIISTVVTGHRTVLFQ